MDIDSSQIRQFLLKLTADLAPGLVTAAGADPRAHKTSFHDIVTVHDEATEEAIRSAIASAYPHSRVLGEEGSPEEAPDLGGLWWIVDPIDGTSNFAAGWPHFAISIAAAVDGEIIAGVVCQPGGPTWSADATGAYVSRDGEESPIAVSEKTQPDEGLAATEFPSVRVLGHDEGALERWREAAMTFRSVRRSGSIALDLAYVAEGLALAAFSSGIHPWDVAAGAFIVTAAGGSYEGWRDGEKISPAWMGPDFVAACSPEPAAVGRRVLGIGEPA